MSEYINKQDAYRIALHDGGPVCAEKIAQLEPLKINLWPDVTDPNIIRQLPTITIDIKPATLHERKEPFIHPCSICGKWRTCPNGYTTDAELCKRYDEIKKWSKP